MEPYDKITPITPSSQLDINTEFIISIQDRYYKLSKQAFLLVLCLSHGEDMDSAITSYQKRVALLTQGNKYHMLLKMQSIQSYIIMSLSPRNLSVLYLNALYFQHKQ